MLIAGLVVADDPSLQRLLYLGQADSRTPPALGDHGRHLQRVEGQPGITSRSLRKGETSLTVEAHRRPAGEVRIFHRPVEERADGIGPQRFETEQSAPADQRRVHFEEGILGRGAHQDDRPVLDAREQGILLRFGEAVDLVQEEHRPTLILLEALLGLHEHFPHVLHTCRGGRQRSERRVRLRGDKPGQGGLPGPGGTPEDHGYRTPCAHHRRKGGTGGKEVRLADDLIQRGRPHPCGERLGSPATCLSLGCEQVLHHGPADSPSPASAARVSGLNSMPRSTN